MSQPAHPRDSGDKNQDPEEGCLFCGLTKISQPLFQSVPSGSHGANYMKEDSSWKGEQRPPLETLVESLTPPHTHTPEEAKRDEGMSPVL
jgi:hypothetical protein